MAWSTSRPSPPPWTRRHTGLVQVEFFNQRIWDDPADATATTVRDRFRAIVG